MSLLEEVKQAGVIGAGGAGFPTHVKLAANAEYILLNGAECEPLLRVDQQLMEVFADEIIQGFVLAGRQVGAQQAIMGIKGKHRQVIQHMRERIAALGQGDFVSVQKLPDVYPAGDEQFLVHALTGRVVPEAGIPIQVGCVVVNSETALNIFRAAQGRPVTEKYLTLAGDIPNRMTLRVPVGTPILDVLRLSGIEDFSEYAVIDGGPMMGPVMKSLDGCITKKNKGFVILKQKHNLIRRKTVLPEQAQRINRASCEQCRMCTDLCPRYLLGHNMQPHKMMRTVAYSLENTEEQKSAYLCCQCNLCELFSCPAGLFPKSANLAVKQRLMEKNIRYQTEQTEFLPRKLREHRLIPSKRLIARLGLHEFDQPAPMTQVALHPAHYSFAMSQHVGAPCSPTVTVGQHVQAGEQVGSVPEGSLGAPVHSSIAGTVVECQNGAVMVRGD